MDLVAYLRAMTILDYIIEDVIKNHPMIFVKAVIRYLEEAKKIKENKKNAEVQEEDNPIDEL